MMDFPFTFELPVCGRCLCEIEGKAIIASDGGAQWSIETIILYMVEPNANGIREMELPRDHMLWSPIMLHLLSRAVSTEIEEQWRKWLRAAAA